MCPPQQLPPARLEDKSGLRSQARRGLSGRYFGISWFLQKARGFDTLRGPGQFYCRRSYCRTTCSPSFNPLSNSVLAPLEMPILTATFFLPSLAWVSGTSTDAFL